MTKQEGGAMNEKIAPILSIEYSTAAHIKNILRYSAFLMTITLCAVCVLVIGYKEVMAAGGWSLDLALSSLIKIGASLTILVCIPMGIRDVLVIGNIYFFEDSLCIRCFIFNSKVNHLRYENIEFHRLINWQYRIMILIFPDKETNLLTRLYKLITKRSSIEIKNKADTEKVLSFLASKNIDVIVNNHPNVMKFFLVYPIEWVGYDVHNNRIRRRLCVISFTLNKKPMDSTNRIMTFIVFRTCIQLAANLGKRVWI